MQKLKEKISKEKAAEYYLGKNKTIKKKLMDQYKNLLEGEKDKIKDYQTKRYQPLTWYRIEALQNKWVLFLFSIRMSKKTLTFDNKFDN